MQFIYETKFVSLVEIMELYSRFRKNIPKEPNSRNKFVQELSEQKPIGNFCRAQEMIPPSTSTNQFPNMSKLSLKRPPQKIAPIFNKENFPRAKRKQVTGESKPHGGGIEYLPIPSPRKKPMLENSQTLTSTQSKMETITKTGRELVALTGSVQFVMKNFRLYPELRALYEVYGNILKITKGKIKFEHNIFLRSESGPVLQGFFFDFRNVLEDFVAASPVRCVGQFSRQSRLHIHKIEQIQTLPLDTVLTRIQNVSAFSLLQSLNTQGNN